MDINKMTLVELELLSYNDIAYLLLKNSKEKQTTLELFKQVGDKLNLTEAEISAKIGDFYTTLTTDKRFLAQPNGSWDLKERNIVKVVIDDDDDSEDIVEIEEVEEVEEEEEADKKETNFDENSDDDFEDDDLEDLGIIDTDSTDDSYDDE